MGDPARDLERAGVAAMERGDETRAAQLLDRALATARQEQDWKIESATLQSLALLAERRGDAAAAELRYSEMLDAARKLGDRETTLLAALAIARLSLDRDDRATTQESLSAARADALALGTLTARGLVLTLEARLLLSERILDEAEATAREAVRLFDVQGANLDRTTAHCRARLVLGEILLARGETLAAITEFRAAATLGNGIGDAGLTAQARESIGSALFDLGHADDACYFLEQAVEGRMKHDDRRAALLVLDRLVDIASTQPGSDWQQRGADYARRADELRRLP